MEPENKQGRLLYFYKKDEGGKLELVMSVHVDNVFMAGKTEALEKIKDIIKLKFNIQESKKVKKLFELYYQWGSDAKRFLRQNDHGKGL